MQAAFRLQLVTLIVSLVLIGAVLALAPSPKGGAVLWYASILVITLANVVRLVLGARS